MHLLAQLLVHLPEVRVVVNDVLASLGIGLKPIVYEMGFTLLDGRFWIRDVFRTQHPQGRL